MEANFLAPNAPFNVSQYPKGRQWFNPYPNGIHYNEAGLKEKAIMQEECKASINKLKEYINDYCFLNDLTHRDCFLIGFSQGAMMSFELGKYINEVFAGCALLSGRILPSRNQQNSLFIKTPIIIMGSGIILFFTGILILTNQLQILGYYILEIFPMLSELG